MILANFIQETPACEEEVGSLGKREGTKELKEESRGNRWPGRNTRSNSTLFIIPWCLSPPINTNIFSSKVSLGDIIMAVWDYGRISSIILLSDKSLAAVIVFPRCVIQAELWYRSNLTQASGGQKVPNFQVFTALCNPFSLSMRESCDLLLIKRMWQNCWDITSEIALCYMTQA